MMSLGLYSYVIQLLIACILYIIPAQKRKLFPLRMTLFTAVVMVLEYIYVEFVTLPDTDIYKLIFWGIFLIVAVMYLYACLDMKFGEAAFAGISAAATQHIAYSVGYLWENIFPEIANFSIVFFVIIYALVFFLYIRKIIDKGHYKVYKNAQMSIFVLTIIVWILNIVEVENNGGNGIQHTIVYRLVIITCIGYIFWGLIKQSRNAELEQDLYTMEQMLIRQKHEYEMTEETISNINRKCHDLKYQIRSIRASKNEEEKDSYLDSLEKDIMMYDISMKTGNTALDVVLMEKGLYCKNHDIQWTCMADGFVLDFMKNEDIYSIFGNAFDNAIEAVMKLKDKSLRVVTVKMIAQGQVLTIQIRNYYDGELEMKNGMPLTSKAEKNQHGFGIRSIKYNVEKYNGIITISGKDNIFNLQIFIPLPISDNK